MEMPSIEVTYVNGCLTSMLRWAPTAKRARVSVRLGREGLDMLDAVMAAIADPANLFSYDHELGLLIGGRQMYALLADGEEVAELLNLDRGLYGG